VNEIRCGENLKGKALEIPYQSVSNDEHCFVNIKITIAVMIEYINYLATKYMAQQYALKSRYSVNACLHPMLACRKMNVPKSCASALRQIANAQLR